MLTTSEQPEPRTVLEPTSTTTPPSVLSQATGDFEQQVLRKLLIDLFYASPRRKSELTIQEVRDGTQEQNMPNPQAMTTVSRSE